MRAGSVSKAAFLLAVLFGCAKPVQTPQEARIGFAALFEKHDPTDVDRYAFSSDPETLEMLKAVLGKMREREAATVSRAGRASDTVGGGLPAPQPGLIAALKGAMKGELAPVVEEHQEGDYLVQKYSNGKRASFRLVARCWKLDLDATEPPFKERLRVMLRVVGSEPEKGSGSLTP